MEFKARRGGFALLAASHSITSSALASSVGGTVRPSDLAVFRLMTNAVFVDCWTGRWATFCLCDVIHIMGCALVLFEASGPYEIKPPSLTK